MSIRVRVRCSDPLFHAALRALLDIQPDLTVLDDSAAAPDVLLVARGELGPEALREWAALTRLVVIVDAGEPDAALSAVTAGARAVLDRATAPEELLTAIRLVAASDTLILPLAARRHFDRVVRPVQQAALHGLTDREREVLRLIASGLSNAQVAAELRVSGTTVRSHVHHLLRKLAVPSRAQAVALAYESGAVTKPAVRLAGRHPENHLR
jgi:DNA-binding NarL/FixJ family response regulator